MPLPASTELSAARIALGLGVLMMAGIRPLATGQRDQELVRVDLQPNERMSDRTMRRVLKRPPPNPGSHIGDVAWNGRAFLVDAQVEGPRTLVLVDGVGQVTQRRVHGSGTVDIEPPHNDESVPPYTLLILSSRGAGMVSDAEPVMVSVLTR